MQIDVISPFPFSALPRIWRWIEPFRAKVSDDFGPQNLADFVSFAGLKWDRQKTWAIRVDGELGGLITFEKLSPWLGTAHWIFKPEFQGRGIAVQASRLALAGMFAEGVGKLAVYPLAGNKAMGSLLVSLGFQREGTLIAQTLCNGKPTDMWVYGLSKSQFEKDKANALGSSSTSTTRSGIVDPRVDLQWQTEDHHQHHHADVLARDAAATAKADGVLPAADGQPGGGLRTDPAGGAR